MKYEKVITILRIPTHEGALKINNGEKRGFGLSQERVLANFQGGISKGLEHQNIIYTLVSPHVPVSPLKCRCPEL